jgi:hypothetical protein
MSISIVNTEKFLETISEKFNIPSDMLAEVSKPFIKKKNIFASKLAESLAEDIDLSNIKPSGKYNKFTANDVRKAKGIPLIIKTSTLFASKAAKELAKKLNLEEKDFSQIERNGRPRKSGDKTITIADVKIKSGKMKPKKPSRYASPQAKKLGIKNKLKTKGLIGSGKSKKLTIADVKKALNL